MNKKELKEYLHKQFEPRVEIKQLRKKGLGVFAKTTLAKDEVVLYYKCRIVDITDLDGRDSTYRMALPAWLQRHLTSVDVDIDKYVCDIIHIPGDIPNPSNGIPYWAFLVNEPSGLEIDNVYTQEEIDNVTIEINGFVTRGTTLLRQIESWRGWVKLLAHGVFVTYEFRAENRIRKGSELLWSYGNAYIRDYETRDWGMERQRMEKMRLRDLQKVADKLDVEGSVWIMTKEKLYKTFFKQKA